MGQKIRKKLRWNSKTRLEMFDLIAFDLDGTLIELNIPFDEIRKELGIERKFILEAIMEEKDEGRRREMFRVLEEFEMKSAATAKPAFYARELLKSLDGKVIKGVITRNSRKSVDLVSSKLGFNFDFVIGREDEEPKPSPRPLELALRMFNVKPSRALMVGDFLFDLISGREAGVKTALIITEKNKEMAKSFIHYADFVFGSLKELADFLRVVK